MKKNIIIPIWGSILSLFMFFACNISEDTDNCPPGGDPDPVPPQEVYEVDVYLSYTPVIPNSYPRFGIDPTEVENVYLYVFDEKGLFYDTFFDEDIRINSEYFNNIDVPPGIYTLVMWAGNEDIYDIFPEVLVSGQTRFEEMYMDLTAIEEDEIWTIPPHLYYGIIEKVEFFEGQANKVTIPIRQVTYDINLTVTGLPETEDEYHFIVRDDNITHGFDLVIRENRPVNYKSALNSATRAASMETSIRTLKLERERSPMMSFHNVTEGTVLLDETDLVAAILTLERYGIPIDFDNMHEFDIALDFIGGVRVIIKVNGWDVSNVIGGLD